MIPKLADSYRIGGEAIQRDYGEALRWYRRAAEQGDACGQNDLGSMYLNALGVERDAAEAARWYRKAADQGLAMAQFNYALRLLWGDGVDEDEFEAVVWLTKACEQGHIEAIGQVGTLFRFGRAVEQSFVTAAQLHVNAARAGDVVSMGNLVDYQADIKREALAGSLRAALCLAMMYDNGVVVDKDAAIAYAWLLVAKRYGCHDDDETARSGLSEHTLACYSSLSSDEKEKAYREFARLCSRRDANEHVCRSATRPVVELFAGRDRTKKRELRIMNHFSLRDSIAFIEEFTGERMTPEGVEELRKLLDSICGKS